MFGDEYSAHGDADVNTTSNHKQQTSEAVTHKSKLKYVYTEIRMMNYFGKYIVII